MNTRIFTLVMKNLEQAFNLPKYENLHIDKDTVIDDLPFTPVRKEKFCQNVMSELDIEQLYLTGTVEQFVQSLDTFYMKRFFGEIWKPNTDEHTYSGWSIVDRINDRNPKNVLDFGCGYNQFKPRIKNLTGIDPFNNQADFMVDILDYNVDEKYDNIIVFGSLNFGDEKDIETRFSKLVNLLDDNGKMYFRVNPGILWPKGPYVDIFPWTFEFAFSLAKKYNCKLEQFKKDTNQRLYFEIVKDEKHA
jgi:SAM-dependent methyltransferase